MVSEIRVEPGNSPVCDFCSDPNPIRIYAADDFTVAKDSLLPQVSEGAWYACKECADLIDSRRWVELTNRSLDCMYRQNPNLTERDRPFLRLTLLDIHNNFRRHMRLDA